MLTERVTAFLLLLGSLNCLMAQTISVDRFLNGVLSHVVGDEVEQAQSSKAYGSLNTASPAEVERVLPDLLQYTRVGSEPRARAYAVLFLSGIAIRPDGADLLSSRSGEISSLLIDANPGIQKVAVVITDYVIGKPATNNQPYLSALQTALQKSQTSQDAAVGMIRPLLIFGAGDPASLKSVLAFLQRVDLTPTTRSDLVHELGGVPGLPDEVSQYLVRRLDDPDPHVRAAALVAYADSTTAYHTLGKDHVQRIANDQEEIPGLRELAREAMAGKINLSPNYDVPAEKPRDP